MTPGVTLIIDPSDDSRTQLPQYDVQSLKVAEPSDMEGKMLLTLKINSLSPQPPPSSIWEVRFTVDDNNSFFVGMETTRGTPRFVYGTIGVTSLVATTASAYKILGDLEPGSGFTPDGTITLVLDKSKLAGSFDISPGRRLITSAFARALTTDPVNAAATSFDPTGTVGYFLRQADCSSLSVDERSVPYRDAGT